VAMLEHPNGWHRDTAARLLFEKQDAWAVPLLQQLIPSGTPLARIHALNVLDGLKVDGHPSLRSADVLAALQDAHPRVREHGARLSEQFASDSEVAAKLAALAGDEDARVRFQAAFSMGSLTSEQRRAALEKILKRDAGDRWLRTAVLTSLQDDTLPAFENLLSDSDFVSSSAGQTVLSELAELVTRQAAADSLDRLAAAVAAIQNNAGLKLELVNRVFRGSAAARSNPAFQQLTRSMIDEARKLADQSDAEPSIRIAGVKSLSLSSSADESERLFGLLNPATPPEVQLAAVDVLASFSDKSIATQLMERFSELSPQLMERTRQALLNRTDWAIDFLTAIADGKISPNAISGADLQRLVGHPDATLKEKAAALLAAQGNSSRDEVIKKYQPALRMVGNTQRGAAVFKQHCSVCHQLSGMGHAVGPNLATVVNRGAESLMVNLLDPNREVNPAWRDYIALTTAGTSHNGVIISESATSLTLRRAEAKEDSLLRSDLETVRDTGRSLMPEGLEKQVDLQMMADLIAWLMEQK
jgi:putative heme-binding domain-containing protein